MKKIILAVLLAISIPSFAEEINCILENGKTLNLRINEKEKTVRYAYGKPDDLELVFSITKSEIESFRSDVDGSKLIRLPHGNFYYEPGEDNYRAFLQVKNRNGKIIFKSYCTELSYS